PPEACSRGRRSLSYFQSLPGSPPVGAALRISPLAPHDDACGRSDDVRRAWGRMRKLRVLFVAGLTPVPGGAAGGQVAQATTLLNSDFARAVDVIPLSSTMAAIPPPSMTVRIRGAWRRMRRFVHLLPSVDVVLVFSANGLSLI